MYQSSYLYTPLTALGVSVFWAGENYYYFVIVFQIPDEAISSAAYKEVDDIMLTVLLVTANILVIAVIAGTSELNILTSVRFLLERSIQN